MVYTISYSKLCVCPSEKILQHWPGMLSVKRWAMCFHFQIINDTTVQAMLHISRADMRRFTRYKVAARNVIGTRHGFLQLDISKLITRAMPLSSCEINTRPVSALLLSDH